MAAPYDGLEMPVALQALTEREAIEDALNRFLFGMDSNNTELFDSAHTEDARWELSGSSGGRVLSGLKAIHEECFDPTISKLDTTHMVTGTRINITKSGSEAVMTAIFNAQHYAAGQGKVKGSMFFYTGGLYKIDFIKDATAGLWKIKCFAMKCLWSEGDVRVMGHD
ncbi:hypothetical protein CGRA01v4_04246 [Colletotrichum graminicola]|uniref:SnoaL-like domain-containing protein n=1 Tax=Colletotrichum graminicola (strain M1.001 / M2 / FGSC 10212) TaxID=645133 RepID=E3R152_COLGM|nr:uncharacterized protein GLRG_11987 [Colletotrichum graminicola M1.001]EFQ36840.1 hypothetical protein GLRG_11987 [Colletotrichum graminicola M1.001]WDK12965.1 hypothetical protein CGRA01v4_04246 [Colletotrichum graminicola]